MNENMCQVSQGLTSQVAAAIGERYSYLPETYVFAALEFEAFATLLENEGHGLTGAQRLLMDQLVDFYERMAVVQ